MPPSRFLERLLRLNGLDAAGFASWELLPGMCFGERATWWRDGAQRAAPHEGLDLMGFRTRDGRSGVLAPGVRVPVFWAGAIAAVVPDFLGRSVFVAHAWRDAEERRLHSVYGHLVPRPGLSPGGELGESDEVGAIADPAGKKTAVPPHLHVTVALIAEGEASEALDWATLRDPARAVLLDPMPLCVR